MKIKNLTPHSLTLVGENGTLTIPPTGQVARLAVTRWKPGKNGGFFRHAGILGPCVANDAGEVTVLKSRRKYQHSATWITQALADLPARRVAFTSRYGAGVIDLPIGVTTAFYHTDGALTTAFEIVGPSSATPTHKVIGTGNAGDSPTPSVSFAECR